MNWENFQEDAYNLTKREARQMTSRVISNYRQAIRSIDSQLKDSYAKYLTGISPENYYNEMIKSNRLKMLLSQIKTDYTSYSRAYGGWIQRLLSLLFTNVYYRKYYAANWLTDKKVLAYLPKKLTELAVLGTNEAWKNITKSIENNFGKKGRYIPQKGTLSNLLANNRKKELQRIQDAITQNLINGNSYTKTVNAIKDIIGREKKVGEVLKLTGSKSSALRIIRTESNRIMNSASYAATKSLESKGIDVRRRVIAVLDNRTRAQSVYTERNNKNIGVDEPIKYPGGVKAMTPGTTGIAKYDINDRETVIDLINGESPQIRRGRNPETGKNEVFSYKDFDQWANDNGLEKNIYGEYIRK